MGFDEGKRGKRRNGAVQHICVVSEVQLNRNIIPLSGSTSAAMSLILPHKDPHLGLVDHFDAL